MIHQLHLHLAQGVPHPQGGRLILLGGQGVAPGVVVGEDGVAGVVEQGLLHDLPDAEVGGGQIAAAHGAAVHSPERGVQA